MEVYRNVSQGCQAAMDVVISRRVEREWGFSRRVEREWEKLEKRGEVELSDLDIVVVLNFHLLSASCCPSCATFRTTSWNA